MVTRKNLPEKIGKIKNQFQENGLVHCKVSSMKIANQICFGLAYDLFNKSIGIKVRKYRFGGAIKESFAECEELKFAYDAESKTMVLVNREKKGNVIPELAEHWDNLVSQFMNPELSASEQKAFVRFYHPLVGFEHFISGVDPDYPDFMFGFANLNDPMMAELGSMSYSELKANGCILDTSFKPKQLDKVIEDVKAELY